MVYPTIDKFAEYFEALHGYPPYDWQLRLAARAVNGDWPHAIDLPTVSGKTACIDVAVFALACQADRNLHENVAPRRVFFCVNRRVATDEAHQRATRIAKQIWESERNNTSSKPVLRDVACALRKLAGTSIDDHSPPLDVFELRGGMFGDNRIARSATQPTIVCTNIDQLGSRLLFRGFGVSSGAASIPAALIAYDSLILLDEAQTSRPFLQTLQSVRGYLDAAKWAEQDIGVSPVVVVPITVLPTQGTSDVFRLSEKDRENDSLARRLKVNKPAKLLQTTTIVKSAVEEAKELTKDRPAAVGIIVNRISTAKSIYKQLRQHRPDAVAELIIGTMRPLDRDDQWKRLGILVGPDRPKITDKTSFIVSTQCLEVGADYDFDALVTECASLDALRQRFSRLNRAGREISISATILMSVDAVSPSEPDPIYGDAMPATWEWLCSHAVRATLEDAGKGKRRKQYADRNEIKLFNFGIEAFNAMLEQHGDNGHVPLRLLPPSASLNAPVMLPAFVDFWSQTTPKPAVEPDVSLFIHGAQRGEPDVHVCWRNDLIEDDSMNPGQWCDVVALLPPTSAECMSVPISRVRRWLSKGRNDVTDHGDLLGVVKGWDQIDDREGKRCKRTPGLEYSGVLWRGANKSLLIQSPDDLLPGDTLVLPVFNRGWNELGHVPEFNHFPQHVLETTASSQPIMADDAGAIDLAETAFQKIRDRTVLRLHHAMRFSFPKQPAITKLFARVADLDDLPTIVELRKLIKEAEDGLQDVMDYRFKSLQYLADIRLGLIREWYPDGRGVVLTTRRRINPAATWIVPPLDEGDVQPLRTKQGNSISLAINATYVRDVIDRVLSVLPIAVLADAFRVAVNFCDLGKADERFQALLRGSDRTDAWLSADETKRILAKSDGVPPTRSQFEAARIRAGLPADFSYEMLSVQLAIHSGQLPPNSPENELILHLIAAHHGFARPFAPVVLDPASPDVEVDELAINANDRKLSVLHRLDSGIATRYWSLTHRFGWWGLAYLEAVFRLAGQQASANEDAGLYRDRNINETFGWQRRKHRQASQRDLTVCLHLPGLDGSNPLGFLAALGAFRSLCHVLALPGLQMLWVPSGGTWIAAICDFSRSWLDQDTVLGALKRVLSDDIAIHPLHLLQKLGIDDNDKRHQLFSEQAKQAHKESRTLVDWLAALASDFALFDAVNQLQTTRRDHFYANLKSIIARTTSDHLRRSIFSRWDYADPLENQSLHIDPTEDRRHAHQWNEPSHDLDREKCGGMLGANRLAIEAIPFFASFPKREALCTLGFSRTGDNHVWWTWPIWQVPLDLNSTRSLLSLAEFQAPTITSAARRQIRERGIAAVFRSSRIIVQKTPCFTPARCIV